MKTKGILLYLMFFVCLSGTVSAQMAPKKYNFNSFTEREQEITDEMRSMTPSEYHDHPEFGELPYNAPCEDCFELIHKRTDSTKLFVKKGSEGKHFYSQATLGLVHYEENDYLKTYDPRLEKKSSGYYESEKQGTPTFVDINAENTGFKLSNDAFKFNNDLELLVVKDDGSETSKGKADWSNYSVGEEGIKIIDAWEGIDIRIVFALDRIKTSYVIKKPLNYPSDTKNLKFSDEFVVPDNFSVSTDTLEEVIDSSGNRYGDYTIENENNKEFFRIKKAYCYDQSGIKSRPQNLYYEFEDRLNLFMPVDWLENDSTEYPVIIDPLVTSSATFTAGWKSFRYNGNYCGGPNGACAYNLNVPRPPNSSLVGASFEAEYITDVGGCWFSCWMSDAGFELNGPCGTDGYYSCGSPGGDSPGTCSSPAAGFDISSLVTCTPDVCNGFETFQIQNSYCYCNYGDFCGFNCQWMPNNSWSVTLEGRTVETLGNTSTGNGSTSVIATSCAGGATTTLDPQAQNGVPGYSYNWNTGESTSTIDITSPSTGDIYTADVTDACGNTVTATFEITCPLAVDLLDFTAENLDKRVALNWSTASERDNDYFEVLKSTDGENYQSIGIVQGAGNSATTNYYSFIDNAPSNGINYYKLRIVDFNGVEEYSPIETVNRLSSESSIVCVPNPTSGIVDVFFNFPKKGKYSIRLISSNGMEVYHRKMVFEKGNQKHTLDTQKFKSGVYNVQIVTENGVHTTKLFVE